MEKKILGTPERLNNRRIAEQDIENHDRVDATHELDEAKKLRGKSTTSRLGQAAVVKEEQDYDWMKAQKLAEVHYKSPEPSTIPQPYVQLGESVISVSDLIQEGAYVRGIVFDSIDPTKMFVLLSQFMGELEKFQREIQTRMVLILADGTSTIDENLTTLRPGLFVMVYCKCGKLEWYRARIRWVERKPSLKIYVKMVDFGSFQVITDLNHIKYMRHDIFSDFQHQSIECKLHFKNKVCKDDEYTEWNSDLNMQTLIGNRFVGIHFKKRMHFENKNPKKVWENEDVWIVTMNLLMRGIDGKGFHTRDQRLTDMVNPYLVPQLVEELQRRKNKKRRIWSMQAFTAEEARHATEHEMEKAYEHGELLSAVDKFNLSDEFAKYVRRKPQPEQKRTEEPVPETPQPQENSTKESVPENPTPTTPPPPEPLIHWPFDWTPGVPLLHMFKPGFFPQLPTLSTQANIQLKNPKPKEPKFTKKK